MRTISTVQNTVAAQRSNRLGSFRPATNGNQSGRGQPHPKISRQERRAFRRDSLLECGCPLMPLDFGAWILLTFAVAIMLIGLRTVNAADSLEQLEYPNPTNRLVIGVYQFWSGPDDLTAPSASGVCAGPPIVITGWSVQPKVSSRSSTFTITVSCFVGPN